MTLNYFFKKINIIEIPHCIQDLTVINVLNTTEPEVLLTF